MKGAAVWGSTSRPCQDCRPRREGRVGAGEERERVEGTEKEEEEGRVGVAEGGRGGWKVQRRRRRAGHQTPLRAPPVPYWLWERLWCHSPAPRHHARRRPLGQPHGTEKPDGGCIFTLHCILIHCWAARLTLLRKSVSRDPWRFFLVGIPFLLL